MPHLSLSGIESPAFVIDRDQLRRNGELLAEVQRASGAKILLALKAFGAWSTFDVLKPLLAGTCASGAIEARLGRQEWDAEVHTYAPAYTSAELDECLELSDHVVFNSLAQWERYGPRCLAAANKRATAQRFGLRINPEHSEVTTALYDPCRPGSRLGITSEAFARAGYVERLPEGITGLHFHTLCELGADALERTLKVVEQKWGALLRGLSWVNFGGGHHITADGYDVELLVQVITSFRKRYGVDVYLEPGEAVALNAGVLLASVIDILDGPVPIAILDVSATAHMPDVLEMPYRPVVRGAAEVGQKSFDYELAGPTCLAGDVIGRYSFEQPLKLGSRLVFEDMAIYSMVKTTLFNGVRHPDIVLAEDGAEPRLVRRFGYLDYRDRLS